MLLALDRARRQLPDPSELASSEPDIAQPVNGNEKNTSRAPIYETPTFDPRSAFARTLRSGEIARLERQQRLTDPKHMDVVAVAA